MKQIPLYELDVKDEDIFSSLNLSLPGLERTKEALDKNDIDSAKKAFVEYMEKRDNVKYYYDYRSKPIKKIDTESNPFYFQSALGLDGELKSFCLYVADKMLENIYVLPGKGRGEIFLGDNFENMIHFNFIEDQGKKHRHCLDQFVRGQFFESLAIAYHETEDRKYIDRFELMLNKFFETYPLKIVDTSISASRFQCDEDRDVMSAGWLTMVYISLFYTRVPYEIPYTLAFEIIKRIWFIGIQFTRFKNDTYRMYNHHLWERGLVPFMLSVLLPEFSEFKKMKKWGASVVRKHVLDDFNAKGGYSEHSVGYCAGAALGEMMSRGIILARINNEQLLFEKEFNRINNAFNVLALISTPGDRFPSIGDNRGPMVNPILNLGVLATGNSYCKSILDKRNAVTSEVSDVPLDYAETATGFAASRSSFSSDANYYCMSVKNNCGYTGHNHMDMLSICLSIKGEDIIGEPYSGKLYHNVKMGSKQRGYMYNMTSHNTVLCYGKPILDDMAYSNKWGVYRPDTPIEKFVTNQYGSYIKASHKAYTICRHVREAYFKRDTGLLIHDTIERGNRINKAHIQRWHLMEGCCAEKISHNCVLIKKNNVSVLMVTDLDVSIKLWKNSKILVPEIYPNETYLYPIIDVSFNAPVAKTADVAAAHISTCFIDITGKENQIKNIKEKATKLLADKSKNENDILMEFKF